MNVPWMRDCERHFDRKESRKSEWRMANSERQAKDRPVSPIAIVGMGGVFPGASDLQIFWENIVSGRDLTREVPPGRWVLDPLAALADGPAPDHVYSLRGCFVEDFSPDLTGLEIDPRRLDGLDPLYHMALHAGRQAFAAGAGKRLDRRRVGVILAAIALPTDGASAITREILGRSFERRLFSGDSPDRGVRHHSSDEFQLETNPLNARVTGLPAALLAEALGLGGGSYTLDAACASSLYALKLACDELRARRADAMLAGGVSRPECLYTQMGFSQLRALSPSGRCAPFDATSDGLVVGEGAGIVLLKRLEDAVRDGDTIAGVIRGIGLSNDIGGSLLAPDTEGQVRAMRAAYEAAGWSPDAVDLIECHGTGTPLGDAVEIRSLRELWRNIPAGGGRRGCPIGSIKSMVGHLLTGAGAAGLIKVLLAMRERTLPPSANYCDSGDVIPLAGSPFRVQCGAEPWRARDERTPRRAAISAFGFGGINAHVLVEEWREESGGCEGNPSHRLETGATEKETGAMGLDSIVEEGCEKGFQPENEKGFSFDPSEIQEPIAIVGMSARFGGVESLEAFEDVVLRAGSALCERPKGRWRGAEEVVGGEVSERHRRGGYLERLAISVGKYGLPPNEISEVLPQQLLMLEEVAAALADAGMPLRLRRDRVGVVVGLAQDFEATNHHLRWWLHGQAQRWAERRGLRLTRDELDCWIAALRSETGPALNAVSTVGALGGMVASRIARECRFGGPCFTVSCDEASGLRALEIATRSLQLGETDVMVAGAVDLCGDVRSVLTREAIRRWGAGEASVSDGVVGEGAACVVLKRLSDAQRDGDRIYAVVRGIGHASGGGLGMGGASESIHRAALGRACAEAGIEPREHEDERMLPASVGDCGAATGMASLVKAAIRLYRGDSPVAAGVTAATLDGNCVHVVLGGGDSPSAARVKEDMREAPSAGVVVVPIGGRAPVPRWPELMEMGSAEEFRVPSFEFRDAHRMGTVSAERDVLSEPIVEGLVRASAATAGAHQTYMRFVQRAREDLGRVLALGSGLTSGLGDFGAWTGEDDAVQNGMLTRPQRPGRVSMAPGIAPGHEPLFSRAMCMEFAVGSLAKVLGPDFAEVDGYPVRVRLPAEPLMLVDRILSIDAEKASLTSGRIVTEHDVLPGAWYLDGGVCPVCIAVEAGQADLFLCSFLGIDLAVRGTRAYRLLDATVTFHRDLPREGETIHYEIRINRFVRQGETWLFFFEYDATIRSELVLTMREGCAGFFTDAEIERSGGIILNEEAASDAVDLSWHEVSPWAMESRGVESYDDRQVAAVRAGDPAGCFGSAFDGLGLDNPLCLPDGRMKLFDRVVELDSDGGRYGLGIIRAEADIQPDDWFLTCHFVDDMTMPGTLMYECCVHTLRFFLLRMGWIGERAGVTIQPMPGMSSALQCRGPVTPKTKTVIYEVEIKEIGYRPEPYVVADALMYADGKRVVRMTDMGVRMAGMSREGIEAVWARRKPCAERIPSVPFTAEVPKEKGRIEPLFDYDRILAFAVGRPSEAFGERYRVFDEERVIARLPGPPYQFIDRITRIESAEAWELQTGAWIEAEYYVPADAWYFRANRQASMPFAVLLEVGL
ncbi:MAG: beta-ketoacyl synthase N-terminal-like domain-containing protein, partial [Phycisphaerae bacterium]